MKLSPWRAPTGEGSGSATETLVLEAAEERERGAGVYLLVRWPDGVEILPIEEGREVSIGRGSSTAITVPDSRVSRQHARLRLEAGRLEIADLGSRNGTLVNQRLVRAAERRLVGGDVVRVGPLEIAIARITSGPAATHPSGHHPEEDEDDRIIVADPVMQRVFEIAHRLAQTQTTVLILGETGAGKDLVARQIHRWSPRAREDLLGFDRTGANDLEGRHGSLFVEEVGDLTASAQVELLATLDRERELRVLCASHRDLEEDVRQGRLRADLYHRINTFTLQLPPLRARPGEIILLAQHHAARLAEAAGLEAPVLAPDAARALLAHSWPGNVRELKNAMEHALVLACGPEIRREHLPARIAGTPPPGRDEGVLAAELAQVERRSIEDALSREGHNQTRAARRLGITRRALIYRMQKLGVDRARTR